MKRDLLILLLLSTFYTVASAQVDRVGSGRAIRFDGIDDYIDLGNIYDDVTLPLTISAWVYVEDEAGVIQYPIFVSQDDKFANYNGFVLVCSTLPHIGFTVGDGKGGNNPAFRRSRAGYFNTMGRWMYMTAVAKSETEMYTYLNGRDVSGDYQGSSQYPMDSNSPGEVAKMGFYVGNSNLTYWFKGIMDEVRIWNRALSVDEIRETMCKRLKGDESGLIGYWNFDETSGDILKDISPKGFDGVLKGNPTRVFSGAPVGDESVFLYTSSWNGKLLAKDNLTVSNVMGNPYGVHLYTVDHQPSQTGGLTPATLKTPYYGVFLADDSEGNLFDFTLDENSGCKYFRRRDNSEADWHESSTFLAIETRIEVIISGDAGDAEELSVDLGDDVTLCDQASTSLQAHADPSGKTFLWNTGATTPAIQVTSNGQFSVTVTSDCKTDSDTVMVSFLSTPPAFSFGEDKQFCDFIPMALAPNVDESNFDFTWQDGSKERSFVANDFGTYWLKIENECGIKADSVTFAKKVLTDLETYNFLSPDNHDTLNQFFTLDPQLLGAHVAVFNRWGKLLFESSNYNNDWDGDNLPAGVYFYTIQAECLEPLKGTLTIMR